MKTSGHFSFKKSKRKKGMKKTITIDRKRNRKRRETEEV